MLFTVKENFDEFTYTYVIQYGTNLFKVSIMFK